MRPVSLAMKGFAPFRQPTEVDFGDGDLVAFVGPTGSGKSSVIDAITFALYGSVARYDNTRLVAPAIHQLEPEARARLDFELAGTTYTAVRVVRRTSSGGGASTAEARLQQDEAVLASGAREVDRAVVDLLGLDFGQFTRTVVLPQGAFAQFLHDEPADRQRLLRQLLDLDVYARMGKAAREQAKVAAQQAGFVAHELERYANDGPAAVAAAEQRVSMLHNTTTEAQPLVAELVELDEQLAALRIQVNDHDKALAALATVKPPADLAELAAPAKAASETREAATGKLAQSRNELAEAREAADATGDPAQWSARIQAAAERVERQTRRAALATTLDEAKSNLATATKAADDAASVASVELTAARHARRHADAGQWSAALVVGEDCPVCRQQVSELPPAIDDDEVARAEQRAAEAQTTATQAARNQADAQSAVAACERQIAEIDRQVEQAGTEPLADVELAERLEAATAARSRLADAEAATRSAETELATAERAEAAAAAATKAAWDTCRSQRDAVAPWSPPPLGDDLAAGWAELVDWAIATAAATQTRRDAAGEQGKAVAQQRAERGLAIDRLLAAAQLERTDQPLVDLKVAAASAAEQAARAAERAAEKAKLTDQASELSTTQQTSEALGRHLSAHGFERWLLAGALDDLVERATERLMTLSSDRYSLVADDSRFEIVDHRNADARRDVRTLSGGETFLASLALALALSDGIRSMATVDAPRLDSVFLDEGFGTLDPETLDVVASAIEELSADGRLVGIITHVRDLADRIPTRFEVRRGPTGSEIEKVEQ